MNPIYLDHNATTPIDPRVAEVIHHCYRSGPANPASQHRLGQLARAELDQARDRIAEVLGIPLGGPQPARLVVTSGGTEANNQALLGLVGDAPASVVISSVEHPSVLEAARQLRRRGHRLSVLPVDAEGTVRLELLEQWLKGDRVRLVSVMMVNHETGVIQPVDEIARLCREYGAIFHCDAVQAIGKLPVNFADIGFGAMSLAAHKFHGPRGFGALVVQDQLELAPLLFGGTQQQGARPGTEDVALAVGAAAALAIWAEQADQRRSQMEALRDRLEQTLLRDVPGLVVIASSARRAPHTSNVALPGVDRQAILLAADQAGVALSAGSACTSGSSEPSHILTAMGCSDELIRGAVRISLGATTTEEEIDQGALRLTAVFRRLAPQARSV